MPNESLFFRQVLPEIRHKHAQMCQNTTQCVNEMAFGMWSALLQYVCGTLEQINIQVSKFTLVTLLFPLKKERRSGFLLNFLHCFVFLVCACRGQSRISRFRILLWSHCLYLLRCILLSLLSTKCIAFVFFVIMNSPMIPHRHWFICLPSLSLDKRNAQTQSIFVLSVVGVLACEVPYPRALEQINAQVSKFILVTCVDLS